MRLKSEESHESQTNITGDFSTFIISMALEIGRPFKKKLKTRDIYILQV